MCGGLVWHYIAAVENDENGDYHCIVLAFCLSVSQQRICFMAVAKPRDAILHDEPPGTVTKSTDLPP